MSDLGTSRILVVDDDPDTLTFLATALRDYGAMVFEVEDGEEALEMARRVNLDLVTLDLSLPGMDGGDVFEALRRDPELADIPVCIISGKPELRGLIYQRDVRPPEGYLDKPVDEKRLLLNLRKILALSR